MDSLPDRPLHAFSMAKWERKWSAVENQNPNKTKNPLKGSLTCLYRLEMSVYVFSYPFGVSGHHSLQL